MVLCEIPAWEGSEILGELFCCRAAIQEFYLSNLKMKASNPYLSYV